MEAVQQSRQPCYYTEFVLQVMRRLEGDLNVISNSVTTTETNIIEDQDATQQMLYSTVTEIINGLRTLSENVDILGLQNGWRGETVSRRIIHRTGESVTDQDYLETLTLAEDIIVIRYIEDHRQLDIALKYSVQIIWNSRFSWRQIMQHLQRNTYRFNFLIETINIRNYNNVRNELSIGPGEVSNARNGVSMNIGNYNNARNEVSISPGEVVDGLPDVIICPEENGNDDEVLCTVCYETFRNGETAKQLECKHVFHSKCIRQWFTQKINCPTCRNEPAPRR